MLYKLRLISIIIFLLISISFVAFTELPNKIITTDLLAKEAGHNISYIISVFAFLTAMAITFPGKAASLSVLLTNTAYKAFEKRETIFIISVVFLLNFTLKFAMSFAVPQTFYYHDVLSVLEWNCLGHNNHTSVCRRSVSARHNRGRCKA